MTCISCDTGYMVRCTFETDDVLTEETIERLFEEAADAYELTEDHQEVYTLGMGTDNNLDEGFTEIDWSLQVHPHSTDKLAYATMLAWQAMDRVLAKVLGPNTYSPVYSKTEYVEAPEEEDSE